MSLSTQTYAYIAFYSFVFIVGPGYLTPKLLTVALLMF